MCNTSQALRRHSAIGGSQGHGANHDITTRIQETKEALDKCQHITLETKDHKPFPPIPNVAAVLSARCGYGAKTRLHALRVISQHAVAVLSIYRYNGDDVTDYAREHCLRGGTLVFDDVAELDRRTRYAGGKIGPKHTFIGQNLGGLFGMKKVDASSLACVL